MGKVINWRKNAFLFGCLEHLFSRYLFFSLVLCFVVFWFFGYFYPLFLLNVGLWLLYYFFHQLEKFCFRQGRKQLEEWAKRG